jgi:hypothetical protein
MTLHRQLELHGQQMLRLEARDKVERKLVDIAAAVMSDDQLGRSFSHPGLCLTVLPYRRRPDTEVWIRRNGPMTLTVQPTADHTGRFYGVPYGSRARLILIFLQTYAMKTQTGHVELGRSMRSWLRNMSVAIGGPNLNEVRQQAKRIERSLVSFAYEDNRGIVSWQDTIIRGSFGCASSNDILAVELSESFYKAITEHPVPLAEAAIRALADKSTALDIYMWLAYRAHVLHNPLLISWPALHAQFGAATVQLKHFKHRFCRDLQVALAAYPGAQADLTPQGIRLHPADPPIGRSRLKAIKV